VGWDELVGVHRAVVAEIQPALIAMGYETPLSPVLLVRNDRARQLDEHVTAFGGTKGDLGTSAAHLEGELGEGVNALDLHGIKGRVEIVESQELCARGALEGERIAHEGNA
jgi:hypothetical protein